MADLNETIDLVGDVLQIGSRIADFNRETALLGSVPEFDSMAVVSVLAAMEESFGIAIDDDEITAEIFETIGSLHDFLSMKLEG